MLFYCFLTYICFVEKSAILFEVYLFLWLHLHFNFCLGVIQADRDAQKWLCFYLVWNSLSSILGFDVISFRKSSTITSLNTVSGLFFLLELHLHLLLHFLLWCLTCLFCVFHNLICVCTLFFFYTLFYMFSFELSSNLFNLSSAFILLSTPH